MKHVHDTFKVLLFSFHPNHRLPVKGGAP